MLDLLFYILVTGFVFVFGYIYYQRIQETKALVEAKKEVAAQLGWRHLEGEGMYDAGELLGEGQLEDGRWFDITIGKQKVSDGESDEYYTSFTLHLPFEEGLTLSRCKHDLLATVFKLSDKRILFGDETFEKAFEVKGVDEASAHSHFNTLARAHLCDLNGFSHHVSIESGVLLYLHKEYPMQAHQLVHTANNAQMLARELFMGGADAISRLRHHAQHDPNEAYRQRCKLFVYEQMPVADDQEILKELLQLAKQDTKHPDALPRLLGRYDDERAESALLDLINADEQPPSVKLHAVCALRLYGTTHAVETLRPLSQGLLNTELKQAAKETIAHIQSQQKGQSGGLSVVTDGEEGKISLTEEGAGS